MIISQQLRLHNLIQHDPTKYVEIDHHSIKEKPEANLICVTYILTDNQLTDIFTKGVNKHTAVEDYSQAGNR